MIPDDRTAEPAVIDADVVSERIARLRERIATHAVRPVTIVAVTKRFGPDAVLAAEDAGVLDVGENYAQELLTTRAAVLERRPDTRVRWHFIGGLQRNKVRSLAPAVALWHTIDSDRVGAEVAKRAPGARVLVQVNLAETQGQGGVLEPEVEPLVGDLAAEGLDVAGLMMIGRAGDDASTSALFQRLRDLADVLELPECSMGMSADLDLALHAGATIVRVGTAIFGPRPPLGP